MRMSAGLKGTPFTITVRVSEMAAVEPVMKAPDFNFSVKVALMKHPSMDYTISRSQSNKEMMERENNAQRWRKKTGR